MSNHDFDASLGLAFSLELFRRYRKSGLLRCAIRRLPGFREPGTICLELVDGKIVASYVELNNGKQYPIAKDSIIHLDNEKGPFEWRLTHTTIPVQATPATPPHPHTYGAEISIHQHQPATSAEKNTPPPEGISTSTPFTPSPLIDTGIPIIVAPLNTTYVVTWTTAQKQVLQFIWNMIDGKQSIRQIKITAYKIIPGPQIDEILHKLIQWKVIVITNNAEESEG